ncbi:MAG: hypothetical protein Q8P34_12190, partial [Bacteroidota bacterium]|nr:hypothetical protein [Bacteroidota bacterium]
HKQMGFENIKEIIVYSQRPIDSLIEFCVNENISIAWLDEGVFKLFDAGANNDIDFDPLHFI